MNKYCLLILFSFSFLLASAGDTLNISKKLTSTLVGKKLSYLEVEGSSYSFKDIQSAKFKQLDKEVVNYNEMKSDLWLKFTIRNIDNTDKKFIEIVQPLLEHVDFYYPVTGNKYNVIQAGQKYPFSYRKYGQSANFLFDLDLKPGEEKTYFFKVKSRLQVLIPVRIAAENNLNTAIASRTMWLGVYCGIILVMVLYNMFIYISIRDKSYLYYVLHTLFVGLTQASLLGFTYKYFWSDSPWFGIYSVILFTCLVSIVGVQFLIEFMRMKERNLLFFRILKGFQGFYFLFVIASLLGYLHQTYTMILATQSVVALFILGVSFYLYKQGVAEAKYYLIGWSSLMICIIIYVAKDYDLLPYNNFTAYSLLFGSATEVTLLSFALADKINIYKSEKEKSQEQALEALMENERIIREQNVMLEKKVDERTHELRIVNADLNKVLVDLKEAEGHLVESEKMAALGQLTAGIAHEINNPINFVTSNVAPLKRDIDMLFDVMNDIEAVGLSAIPVEEKNQKIEEIKEEIDFDYLKIEISHLLKGINEGANRTAEIVKGLRIFSRVDENDLKKANINEGLDSTMVLVNNLLNNRIELIRDYGDIPPIDCYPGKLNQVFLNIITNAIQAINQRHGEASSGVLKIHTGRNENSIFVKVEDNGTGMDENTKKKVFEPFFTTKEVGEGTGLGMSIAYNIIKKHNGQIHINSTPGAGTEFILDLPIIQN
jgi:signal transduction histidine kinase